MEASALHAPAGLQRLIAAPLLRLRSDEQLVALFRAGSDEAFDVIHDRYRVRLLAYARQMLGGSVADAEDALQDVFVRAFGALRADERPVSLRAWLYRVAHNRCVDQLRRPQPAPGDVLTVNRGLAPRDPSAESERREALRRLVEDVRALPGQQRSALLMREMEGLTYLELAAALDVSVPAVKSLLVRARIGLAEAIEARDAPCAEVRAELAEAADAGSRAAPAARRHARGCEACGTFRDALRVQRRALASMHPGHGPLTALLKLVGLGGSGAAGGAAATGGGAVAVVGGTGAATKIAAVVCCAAVVGGGAAVEVRERTAAPARGDGAPAPAPALTAPGAEAIASPVRRAISAGVLQAPDPHAAARPRAQRRRSASLHAGRPAPAAPLIAGYTSLPSDVEVTTGGLAAPDEPEPAVPLVEQKPAPPEPVVSTQEPAVAAPHSADAGRSPAEHGDDDDGEAVIGPGGSEAPPP